MGKRESSIEISGIGIAIAAFAIGGAVMMGIESYQEGEVDKLDKKLQIEKERTKQLKYERDSTNTER